MVNILIIKLGAKGDVVRTIPILKALNKKYKDADFYWITKPGNKEILSLNPNIKEILTIPLPEVFIKKLNKLNFDFAYNFDIEKDATNLIENISSKNKFGFKSDGEYTSAYNLGAEYYLNTLFDDEIKKNNKKTYQEMMFMASGITFNKEPIDLKLSKDILDFGESFLKKNNLIKENIIGIHIGASSRWPSKVWHFDRLKEFIEILNQKNYKILIFGGPNEIEAHKKLIEYFKKKNIVLYQNDLNNSDKEFIALVNICKKMVCSDSFSLHISLALKKPTLGLFFCTPPNEIEGYGLLKKIISSKLYEYFPEKMNEYSKELVKSISAEEVIKTLEK